jgi:hypothetical protein
MMKYVLLWIHYLWFVLEPLFRINIVIIKKDTIYIGIIRWLIYFAFVALCLNIPTFLHSGIFSFQKPDIPDVLNPETFV